MLAKVVTSDWLIPFAVVFVAALFAYLGGWVVKRQDVERSIAEEADDLLEEAQKLAADTTDGWSAELVERIRHLVQTAGMRSRRLDDKDIEDRFFVCDQFLIEALLALKPDQPYWAEASVSNVRLGLDAFTSPPSIWPWRVSTNRRKRIFPTQPEYKALMQYDDENAPRVEIIATWQSDYGVR